MRKLSQGSLWAILFGILRGAKAFVVVPAVFMVRMAYGKPQLAPKVRSVATSNTVKAVEAKQSSAQAPVEPATPMAIPEGDAAIRANASEAAVPATHAVSLEPADRVKTLNLMCGDLLVGCLWLYLYPKDRKVRRVFKVQDTALARALNFKRYYYEDVPYDPAGGESATDKVMDEFFAHVEKQLNRRKAPSAARAPQAKPVPAAPPVVKPVPEQRSQPVKAAPAPRAEPKDQPKSSGETPSRSRPMPVQGEATIGVVTHTGMTKRHGSKGSYNTFGLTINDGVREIPFFGAEIGRLVGDLEIQVGEKVRVIPMGRQLLPYEEGEKPIYKNLFQVTRVGTA